jgi:hypothetical protein
MEIYEQAELLLLGARQCDRCSRPDIDSRQVLAGKDEKEPSAWYCSNCAPHVETRARVSEASWQAEGHRYYCTQFPQSTSFNEGTAMDACAR